MRTSIQSVMIKLIKFYQNWVSPIFPQRCRFNPTCSEYFIQALKTHGLFKGTLLGIRRISKCHPWGSKGIDPVPAPKKKI